MALSGGLLSSPAGTRAAAIDRIGGARCASVPSRISPSTSAGKRKPVRSPRTERSPPRISTSPQPPDRRHSRSHSKGLGRGADDERDSDPLRANQARQRRAVLSVTEISRTGCISEPIGVDPVRRGALAGPRSAVHELRSVWSFIPRGAPSRSASRGQAATHDSRAVGTVEV